MIIISKEEREKEDVKILKKEDNKKFLKSKNNSKGITLIALVITIIVLLILAGVTISMLTGENGILTKASNAQTETKNKGAIEKVQVEIMGSYGQDGKINIDDLNTNLGKIQGITGLPITAFPSIVTVDGTQIKITQNNGILQVAENVPNKPVTDPPTSKVEENTIFIDTKSGSKEAVIPQGFKVSNLPLEQKIDAGLVVIGPDESEFVWIPVDKETLCVDGTVGKEIANVTSGVDKNGKINYQGKLYNFSGTTSNEKSSYGQGTISCREPDIVTNYDGNITYLREVNSILGTSFANSNDFKTYLQEEYNNIIGSIKINGGYYVGRYESSITGSTATTVSTTGNIQSKKGVMPTSAGNSGTNMWYGLYAKQKVYASSLLGVDTKLKSGMITGSMYDGMLNFALNGADKAKITANSTNHGPEKTGNLETDKINNVYDLGNNVFEWTTEALGTASRVLRRWRLWKYLSSQLA